MLRSTESTDDLADRFSAGRTRTQLWSRYWSLQGELTAARGTVAVTEFVFVKGHTVLKLLGLSESLGGRCLRRSRGILQLLMSANTESIR